MNVVIGLEDMRGSVKGQAPRETISETEMGNQFPGERSRKQSVCRGGEQP